MPAEVFTHDQPNNRVRRPGHHRRRRVDGRHHPQLVGCRCGTGGSGRGARCRRGRRPGRAAHPGDPRTGLDGRARLPGRPRPRTVRRAQPAARVAQRPDGAAGLPRPHRRLRPRQPGRAVDRGRGLGDGALSRWAAGQGGPRRGRPRPAGVPHEPRRPRRLGQLAGAGAGRHHRRHGRPGRRADRTRPTDRGADRRPARGSGLQLPGPARAAAHAPRLGAGDPGGPGAPALARDHRLAGRVGDPRHPGGLPEPRGRRAADRPRGRRALVGPAPRAGPGHRLPHPA